MISTGDQLLVAKASLYPATRGARTRFKKARLRLEGVLDDEWASAFKIDCARSEYGRARLLLFKAIERAKSPPGPTEAKGRGGP